MIKCLSASGGLVFSRLIDRMEKKRLQILAPLAAVACLLAFAAFEGCERKPEVNVSRGSDPAYTKELKEQAAQQARTAAALAKITRQMDMLKARARRALGENATDEQIKAELDGNPAKYAGWRQLTIAYAKANARAEKELADVRGIVRRRIEKEAADQRTVAAGKTAAASAASK